MGWTGAWISDRPNICLTFQRFLLYSEARLAFCLVFDCGSLCYSKAVLKLIWCLRVVDCVWNVMAHPQKPDFVFRAKRTSPFKSAGGWRQFSRLLAAEVCASAVVMLDTPCSEVVWRVLATHSIRQFPLHFPSLASPCAITFQLNSTNESFGRICCFPLRDIRKQDIYL